MTESTSSGPGGLHGQRYVVTGAAGGIGAATAVLISESGGMVCAVDVDEQGLRSTLQACRGKGHRSVVVDLTDLEAIGGWMETLAVEVGGFHGLVHSAGVSAVQPLRTLTVQAWRKVFAINTEAGLALAQAFQRKNVYAGVNGSIVFISSVMGLVGDKGAVAYSMSKAALHGISRSLALELAGRKIRVNCVAPGFVRTPMLERTEKLWTAEQKAYVESLHPLGIAEADDVANAVVFLLAQTGRMMTGSVMVVDGGYTAH